jgi:hypothetical protein
VRIPRYQAASRSLSACTDPAGPGGGADRRRLPASQPGVDDHRDHNRGHHQDRDQPAPETRPEAGREDQHRRETRPTRKHQRGQQLLAPAQGRGPPQQHHARQPRHGKQRPEKQAEHGRTERHEQQRRVLTSGALNGPGRAQIVTCHRLGHTKISSLSLRTYPRCPRFAVGAHRQAHAHIARHHHRPPVGPYEPGIPTCSSCSSGTRGPPRRTYRFG